MSQLAEIKKTLKSEAFIEAISETLPKQITAERFARIVITGLTKTPKLLECTRESILKCIMDCGTFGIIPDGRNAYLIPYGSECTLILSYLGLIGLAKRNGKIRQVYSHLVYANDYFEMKLGLHRDLDHVPAKGDRGDLVGAYAIVLGETDRDFDFEYMEVNEIMAIAKRSKAYKYGPWQTDLGEMQKKTVIRRLLKRQTLNPEFNEISDLDADRFDEIPHAEKVDESKHSKPLPTSSEDDEMPDWDEIEKNYELEVDSDDEEPEA